MRPVQMAANRLAGANGFPRRIDAQNGLRHLLFAGIAGARVDELQIDREMRVVVSGQAIGPWDLVRHDNGLVGRVMQSVFQISPRCGHDLSSSPGRRYPKLG